jgi:hypothetical protein
MRNFHALRCCSGADFGMAMTEVHHTNTSREVEQLDALVGGDESALALIENMLGETANALGNVLLAKSRGVHI